MNSVKEKVEKLLLNHSELSSNAAEDGSEELKHWRPKGSKNGVRRWTNPDGTLNEAGKQRYAAMYGKVGKDKTSNKSDDVKNLRRKDGKQVSKDVDDAIKKLQVKEQAKKETREKQIQEDEKANADAFDQLTKKLKPTQTEIDANEKPKGKTQDKQPPENQEEPATKASPKKVDVAGKLGKASGVAAQTGRTLEDADRVNTAIAKIKNSKKTKAELKEMDDKQLRDRVNRLNMEQQYKNLTADRMSDGQQRVGNVLKVSAAVAATTASALGIARIFTELLKK